PPSEARPAGAGELRRALARLAILALVFFVGDRVVGAGLRSALPHSHIRFSLALHPSQERRVLILGDSHPGGLVATLISRRLGVPVLNLSFSLMSTLISEAMLRGYLDHNPPPRLLVIELDGVREEQSLINGLMCYWD